MKPLLFAALLALALPVCAQTVVQHRATGRNECPINSDTCAAQTAMYSGDAMVACISLASVDWPAQQTIKGVTPGKWLHNPRTPGYWQAASTDCQVTFNTIAGVAPVVQRSSTNPVPWFVWSAEVSARFLPVVLGGNSQDPLNQNAQVGVTMAGSSRGTALPVTFVSFQILRGGGGEYESTYPVYDFADHVCAGVAMGLEAPVCTAANPGQAVASAVVLEAY